MYNIRTIPVDVFGITNRMRPFDLLLENRSASHIFLLHVISSTFGINISRAARSTLDSKIELADFRA